jgi:hypothetical protein
MALLALEAVAAGTPAQVAKAVQVALMAHVAPMAFPAPSVSPASTVQTRMWSMGPGEYSRKAQVPLVWGAWISRLMAFAL